MIRLAYLIAVHDQPDQLRRLVDAIHCDWTRVYIHVDKKSDIREFVGAVGERPGVRFLADRVNANWMGFSLVEASLKMLSAAAADGFDYCVLLSGADYPIKSNEHLHAFFSAATKEYIAFWRLQDRPSWLGKVQYFYPLDEVPIRPYMNNAESNYFRRLFWGRYFKYQRFMPKRSMPRDLIPYGGPDWWSLSHECVRYVLQYVENNPDVTRFFKHTSSPGELFFQTIIMNSQWAERVNNCDLYAAWSQKRHASETPDSLPMLPDELFNYRYVDWSGEVNGERESPAILDERDLSTLLASASHFARKFHSLRSAGLRALVDEKLLSRAEASSS